MMEACCSRFTSAEGGARLAAAAATKNILAVEYASFIPVRLLYEKAYQIRGSLSEGRKRSVYITRASRVQVVAFELKILTDLATAAAQLYSDVNDWSDELETKEVLICTSSVLKQLLEEQLLSISNINVLIIDSCHLIYSDQDLKYIMRSYKECPQADQPTILALTYPLFSTKKDIDKDNKNKPNDTNNTQKDLEQQSSAKEGEIQEDNATGKTEIENTKNDENQTEINDKSKAENEIEGKEIALKEDIKEEMTNREGEGERHVQVVKQQELGEEMGVYENLDDFDMYEKLEWKIEELESELCCQMDLAEDIDGGKRTASSISKPKELIIEYGLRPSDETLPALYQDVDTYMRVTVQDALHFIDDHRHDPTEIYGEEMYDEFMSIPDPKIDPTLVFKQFLYVLDQLGPYAADKAAFALLTKLEKLKIKIPYERHFILMCLCTTVFLKIRCYAEMVFEKVDDEWERLKTFSSPKIMRLAEILEKFKPPDIRPNNSAVNGKDSRDSKDRNEVVSTGCDNLSKGNLKKMLSEIEDCDFASLGDRIEDRVNTYVCNLKDLDYPIEDYPLSINSQIHLDQDINETDIPESAEDISNNESSTIPHETTNVITNDRDSAEKSINRTDSGVNIPDSCVNGPDSAVNQPDSRNTEVALQQRGMLGFPRRAGYRMRGKSRMQRNNAARVLQMQQNPDALCGIVFMKEPLMAKILFMVLVDMSRSNPHLSYLSVQYCGTELPADPGTEPRECLRQGKRQEDVLKKFRMHECNLLLATSALEEGIDLPRCNLVLRWDVPPSYRSYGLCRGRARATRATAALLCSNSRDTTDMLLQNVATYRELDQIISRKCGCGIQDEPPQTEEDHADAFTSFVKPYTPLDTSQNIQESKDTKDKDKDESKDKNAASKSKKVKFESKVQEKVIADNANGVDTGNNNNIRINSSIDNNVSFNNDDANIHSKNNNESITEEVNTKNNAENIINNAVKTVNNVVKSVNEVINNVNEAVNIGINDLINQIIDETASLNVSDELENNCDISNNLDAETSQNSETGELEVKLDKNHVDNDNHSIRNEIDIEPIKTEIENHSSTNDSTRTETDIEPNTSKIDKQSNDKEESIKEIELSFNNCEKCYNVKISGVCLCANVNMYYQLLAKASAMNKSDFKKNISENEPTASVDLSTAIALINRYCGKLPSDTFTRLAPQWWMEEIQLPVAGYNDTRTAYICTLRLPLNCPVKYNIVGHPMPTKVLARRMVALQACRILHKSGELDNQLMPIGKENFKAAELGGSGAAREPDAGDSARPGTTKRRQYYYKRTAWAFTDCQPVIDSTDEEIYPGVDPSTLDIDSDTEPGQQEDSQKEEGGEEVRKEGGGKKRNMLYAIVCKLWCALPERYNTRGRRLHAPQLASQAIGILMSRHEPDSLQIPAFPVYTRSGEVRVSVEHVPSADVRVCPRRAKLVRRFMRFVFAEVLRVRRRGMKLQSEGSTHNNYYIVPTVKTTNEDGTHKIDIDWAFLELIYQHTEEKKLSDIEKPLLWQDNPDEEHRVERESHRRRRGKKRMANPLLKKGEVFVFDAEKYSEAVVTPWYRNQDQPQFFLVAEICWNLTPDSSFPSATHQSFRDYYSTKYGVSLTQREQPLLDVDHTSARLNLLTPRYVNRKGVALPVSSERTRRAKRDRLDQKQILIPELCRVHPFAAPLWFATVALPCVLYRINALLIADEIRRAVAIDVGLGIPKINEDTMPGFQWPALDFGWSLAEVLNADSEKNDKKKEEEESKKEKEEKEKKMIEEGQKSTEVEKSEEVREKTINDILQEKEDAAAEAFEIGTWSNDMASSIPESSEFDELMEPLPSNLTFCTSASGGTDWCDPTGRHKYSKNFAMADSDDSFMSSDLDSDDSELDYDGTDEETDTSGYGSARNPNTSMGVRIEYKTAHEAEAFDIERVKKVNPAPLPDDHDDAADRAEHDRVIRQGSAPQEYIEKFRASVAHHKQEIIQKNHLITKDNHITDILPETKDSYHSAVICKRSEKDAITELFPYGTEELTVKNGQIDIESIEKNKRKILQDLKNNLSKEEVKKLNCFAMKDINIDSEDYVNEKVVNVGFDTKEGYEKASKGVGEFKPYYEDGRGGKEFDFDYQPTLEGHPGPSPSVILQALTMSNANDGINLERLETIGDSFLKFAITAYLYCAHPTVHEGKLSHMRSKQVSNLNLYRLGRNKRLGARMIASKFEPHDNWLPPCHKPPPTLHPRINGEGKDIMQHLDTPQDSAGCFIPYNLITQHSIPDKSIADCVEALIGAYLLECGPRGALLFMSWLGIRVLPCHHVALQDTHPFVATAARSDKQQAEASPRPPRSRVSSCSEDEAEEVFPAQSWSWPARAVGSLRPYTDENGRWMQPIFGELKAPPSPLLRYIEDPDGELEQMLSGYDALERTLQYRFKDRSLLLQALTHASHHANRLTDCYQRLEFLGDAILDYLITRHLYEDGRRHSPGALTDLRSALVNNTIFATLAARHGFHKYFRHMSPGLNEVLTKYVKIQEENGHSISEEHYLIQEDEMEQAEDVEVPKALGDLFESVAGAIFLDSGMSLGAVWKSYVNLMGAELEAFSAAAPKSPVRELLEAEPDTAKFGKPERLADGRRVRVCVEVFGRGTFKGVGRNYRIAKGTAARCALRHLKVHRPH
nr:endoribonuclease Dcr-1 isoform X1 [Helicoverpa armigera]XP_049696044.1 endoribonuclease Dcr-1 isoform X1 [Helicoverpa armigera]